MSDISANPIGIFDSGIGGLTVAHAVKQILPNEDIIYFGDTAHLPYGDKSAETIQKRALVICDFLIQKKCKLILIACNSASAAAFDVMSKHYKKRIKLFNVIDPVVDYVNDHYTDQTIGLIGTWQTIGSNVYLDKLKKLKSKVSLKSLATPLLASMIEDGFCHDKIAHEVLNEYLSAKELQGIDALILGCTHYPIIKNEFESFYKKKVTVLDSPKIVAKALKLFLQQNDLLNKKPNSKTHTYVSDLNEHFALSAQRFFAKKITLEICEI